MQKVIEHIIEMKLTRGRDVAGAGGFYDYAMYKLTGGIDDEHTRENHDLFHSAASTAAHCMWDVYENMTQFW